MVLLLTGGGGHVGEGVAKAAAKRGLIVVATYRGAKPPATACELGDTVHWVACDLTDKDSVKKLATAYDIQQCIHCAAVPNEAFARPDPLGAFEANVSATANLLEVARLNDWKRFILVSTGSVFQLRSMKGDAILENERPQPQDIYSTTKTSAEMLCRMYRTEYGISASVVRISWVYGPPIIAHTLTRGPIPSFLIRAFKGEAIDEGGSDFAVSFTFVEDVAAGLLAAAKAKVLNHPIYHLGPGRNISLGEAAAAIKMAVPEASIKLASGTEPWTKFTALRDPLGGTNLFEDTGWQPAFSINKGVQLYADWLRKRSELWSN